MSSVDNNTFYALTVITARSGARTMIDTRFFYILKEFGLLLLRKC